MTPSSTGGVASRLPWASRPPFWNPAIAAVDLPSGDNNNNAGRQSAKLGPTNPSNVASRSAEEPWHRNVLKCLDLGGPLEVSAFTNAFRRWAGKTPQEARSNRDRRRKEYASGPLAPAASPTLFVRVRSSFPPGLARPAADETSATLSLCRRHRGRSSLGAIKPAF
jgi:hypothetical protein